MPYVPISSENLKTGQFGRYSQLTARFARTNAAVHPPVAPVATPPAANGPPAAPTVTDFLLQSVYINSSIVADLQLSSYFTTNTANNAIFYLMELLMLVPGASTLENGVIQLSGCGFRAVLATASSNTKIGSNILAFAARGELSAQASSWTSEVRGLNPKLMTQTLQDLATPVEAQSFNLAALGKLNQALSDTMTALATQPLQPEPLYAYIPVEGEYNDANLAVSAWFAANQIKSGKNLNQALSAAQSQAESSSYTGNPGLQLTTLTIAEVYRDIAGIDISLGSGSPASGLETPSKTAKSSAASFLSDPIEFAIAGGE